MTTSPTDVSRTSSPGWRTAAPTGRSTSTTRQQCWQVLGHPETVAVLSDPAVFSSDLTALQPDQDDLALFQRGNFVRMDPPQHRKLRTLVSQAFTPKVVAGLEPRIAELTNELLDRAGERFDLIDALAYPLPVIVIAELLGIPISDRALFRKWADVLLSQDVDPDQSLIEAGERGGGGRRADHAGDERLLPGLHQVPAGRPGQRPDQQAGPGRGGRGAAGRRGDHRLRRAAADRRPHHDHRDPGQQRASPSRTTRTPPPRSGPTRRCSRRRSRRCCGCARPFPRLARLTKADTEVGGVPIPAGQIVLPWLAAANRDERVFAEPAPVRHPPQAQPAPDLRARHPLLPRRAACPAGGQGRAAAAAGALPRHRGRRRRAGRAPQPVDDGRPSPDCRCRSAPPDHAQRARLDRPSRAVR